VRLDISAERRRLIDNQALSVGKASRTGVRRVGWLSRVEGEQVRETSPANDDSMSAEWL
jgi:hypothetical protein